MGEISFSGVRLIRSRTLYWITIVWSLKCMVCCFLILSEHNFACYLAWMERLDIFCSSKAMDTTRLLMYPYDNGLVRVVRLPCPCRRMFELYVMRPNRTKRVKRRKKSVGFDDLFGKMCCWILSPSRRPPVVLDF